MEKKEADKTHELDSPRMYKIISWFSKWLGKMGKKMVAASEQLRFMKYRMEFGERDDDIYIVTYPKSGTTLTQMILYQLTTDGNVEFDHIYEVSPWIKNDCFKRIPPRDLPSPRLIKSHDTYDEFDKDIRGRFIYVYRNVMDVAVSMYHQRKNYGHPNLDFDDFIENFMKPANMNWFTYNRNWLQNKKNLPILYLTYEDLTNNLEGCIERITKFCNFDQVAIDLDRVKERSSFDFMKAHEDKFGEQPVELPPFVYDQFIRKGQAGAGETHFSKEQKERIQAELKEKIGGLEQKLHVHKLLNTLKTHL